MSKALCGNFPAMRLSVKELLTKNRGPLPVKYLVVEHTVLEMLENGSHLVIFTTLLKSLLIFL